MRGGVFNVNSENDVTHLGNGVYMVQVDKTYSEEKAVEVARMQANLDWKEQVIEAHKNYNRDYLQNKPVSESIDDGVQKLAEKLPNHKVVFVPKNQEEKSGLSSFFEFLGVIVFTWLILFFIMEFVLPALLGEKKS
jgi:lauroyl/myristoyl acyltransferase